MTFTEPSEVDESTLANRSHAMSGSPRLLEPLTKRELEMIRMVCEGHSNKAVSKLTCVEENTVKYHLKNIFRKLGAKHRTHAVVLAIQLGVIEPGWLNGALHQRDSTP